MHDSCQHIFNRFRSPPHEGGFLERACASRYILYILNSHLSLALYTPAKFLNSHHLHHGISNPIFNPLPIPTRLLTLAVHNRLDHHRHATRLPLHRRLPRLTRLLSGALPASDPAPRVAPVLVPASRFPNLPHARRACFALGDCEQQGEVEK